MTLELLLGDDHTIVRQGLRKILEAHPGWVVAAEAADGREAVRLAVEVQPRVAVLDITMPLLNGIEATRQIVKRAPNVGVLILSMHGEAAFIIPAVQAGARGYVLKNAADTELIRAVTVVASGASFFSEPAASTMLNHSMHRATEKGMVDPYESLSHREREIFQLIAEGHSNKGIAGLLSISVTTVETHRAHVLQKLHLHSAAEVVRLAIRRGVIS